MNSLSECPGSEELLAYSLGKLAHESLEAIAGHVDECSECQARLTVLGRQDDSFAVRVRRGSTAIAYSEEECRQALILAKQTRSKGVAPPAAGAVPEKPTADLRPFGQLREYRLLARLGEGGMGVVYQAVHTRLDKPVSLKVLSSQRTHDPEAVARFQREMKAVGKLDHPNIIRATDAGEVDGTHFLVMEFVEGIDLARLVRQVGPLPVADACELIRQAALGLEHAHAHGLIHRDVKPSNLLLSRTGQVKVLDLGLALLHGTQPAAEGHTASGVVMGTFDYVAPEQASNSHTVDGRADLYSLGCTLYELLTGQPPFGRPAHLSPMEKLKAHALTPPPSVRDSRPEVPAALAAILDRLLAKDPADRHDSAAEVAEALQPFTMGCDLAGLGQPRRRQGAGMPGAGTKERVASSGCWRWGLAAAAALLLALAGVAVVYVQTDNGVLEIETVDDEVQVIVEQGGKLVTIVDLKSKKQIKLRSGKYQLKLGEGGDDLELDVADVTLERHGKVLARIRRKPAVQKPGEIPPLKEYPLPSGPPGEIRRFEGHQRQVCKVAVTPDGKVAVSCGKDAIRVWDVATGQELRRLEGFTDIAWAIAISPDGKQLLSGGGGQFDDNLSETAFLDGDKDFTLRLWDLETGKLVRRFGEHEQRILSVAFSPDGKRALSGSVDRTVRLWDVETGKQLKVMRGHTGQVVSVAYSPDPARPCVLSAGTDQILRLWNLDTGETIRIFSGHTGLVNAVAFSPDGRLALSGSVDRTMRLWDVASGEERRRFPHPTGLTCVAFSPDGRRVLSGSGVIPTVDGGYRYAGQDALIRLWDAKTGQLIRRFQGHYFHPTSVVCLPDGYRALSGGEFTLRLWRLEGTEPAPVEVPLPRVVCVHDLDAVSYLAWLNQLDRTGFRPTFVHAHDAGGQPRYAGIAVRGGFWAPWWVKFEMDWREYHNTLAEYRAKGYRPFTTIGYADGETMHYAYLVIRDGKPGGSTLLTGAAAYQLKLKELAESRQRPAQVQGYPAGNSCGFALTHEPDDGTPYLVRHDLPAATYPGSLVVLGACTLGLLGSPAGQGPLLAAPALVPEKTYQEFLDEGKKNGYRPISASAYQDGGRLLFTAVLLKDNPKLEWQAKHALTADQFRQENEQWMARGYRPLIISGYWQDGASRYLAVWVRDELGQVTPLPQTGKLVPELETFDEVMQRFMGERAIRAGTLAVVKDGRLVLAHGYGYADAAGKRRVEPEDPFRMASLTKLITAAAIRKLVRAGKLQLDTRIVDLLAVEPPPGKERDPRLQAITIQHLLDHQGGWDRDAAGDPLMRSSDIAAALGKPGPPSAADVLHYMAGQPLQFAPGSRMAYSNFGYLVLGRVIEKVTGQSYFDYVQQEILAPLGIKSVALARTLPGERQPREPAYVDPTRGRNVLQPDNAALVAAPDGTFCLETMDSCAGLIASAVDLARFLKAYRINGEPATDIPQARFHTGSLPGTWSLAVQRTDGVQLVVLFNQRADPSLLDYESLRELLEKVADNIRDWPVGDEPGP